MNFAGIHYTAEDRLMIAAPLFHCWGLINGVLATCVAGGTAIVVRRFQTEPVLDLIERTRPTILLGVATMINYMTKSPTFGTRDLSSLRLVLCAAAPTPLELIEALHRDWKVGYAESYGLTETSPVITTTHHSATRPGSCGRAMGDTTLKVTDATAGLCRRRGRRTLGARDGHLIGLFRRPTPRPRSSPPTAGSGRATSPGSTTTDTSRSSTG